MKAREVSNYIIGALLILSGVAVTVFEPSWIISVSGAMGGLIGAGVALIAVNYVGRKQRKDNRPDERDFQIAERAAYRSFQVTFPVIGFSLAFLGLTELSFRARTAVSLIFGVMGVSYGIAFFYYRRRM